MHACKYIKQNTIKLLKFCINTINSYSYDSDIIISFNTHAFTQLNRNVRVIVVIQKGGKLKHDSSLIFKDRKAIRSIRHFYCLVALYIFLFLFSIVIVLCNFQETAICFERYIKKTWTLCYSCSKIRIFTRVATGTFYKNWKAFA